MAGAMTWWRRLSQREQLLVAIMLVLLLGVGLWLGIVRPLAALRDDLTTRQTMADATLTDVTSMGRQIRTARATAGPQLPLLERVRTSADAAGLTLEQLEKAGDGSVTLRIAAVRSPALLGWLADLETRQGVVVDRLSATRNDDASLAVDIALRNRAA
jgi:general secretion pathway protein M